MKRNKAKAEAEETGSVTGFVFSKTQSGKVLKLLEKSNYCSSFHSLLFQN